MKKLLLTITALFIGAFIVAAPTPVFAANTCDGVETAILGENGCMEDDGCGSSILSILNSVLDIMTVCIGIVAAVGIAIVGVQYMTAGDNEEQVRKSKRRLFEIIIGLAAYVLIYALLKWLGIEPSLAAGNC
ncbi:MAG: hypothetical protein Q4B34_00360 [Candidatus Saccharibacteria bacterium]|nr:hypothetical protein [Candidatus Saccharibacteria bacterium]